MKLQRQTLFFLLILIGAGSGGCSMQTPQNNIAVYFEIPVKDMARARLFYQRVFAVTFTAEVIDNHPMALFPFHTQGSGITGALAYGDSYEPGQSGIRIYFAVTDIDATLDLATAAGGRIFYPKKQLADVGWVAEIIDSEGNIIALQQAL